MEKTLRFITILLRIKILTFFSPWPGVSICDWEFMNPPSAPPPYPPSKPSGGRRCQLQMRKRHEKPRAQGQSKANKSTASTHLGNGVKMPKRPNETVNKEQKTRGTSRRSDAHISWEFRGDGHQDISMETSMSSKTPSGLLVTLRKGLM